MLMLLQWLISICELVDWVTDLGRALAKGFINRALLRKHSTVRVTHIHGLVLVFSCVIYVIIETFERELDFLWRFLMKVLKVFIGLIMMLHPTG